MDLLRRRELEMAIDAMSIAPLARRKRADSRRWLPKMRSWPERTHRWARRLASKVNPIAKLAIHGVDLALGAVTRPLQACCPSSTNWYEWKPLQYSRPVPLVSHAVWLGRDGSSGHAA